VKDSMINGDFYAKTVSQKNLTPDLQNGKISFILDDQTDVK